MYIQPIAYSSGGTTAMALTLAFFSTAASNLAGLGSGGQVRSG
jgi:hypothetical protein